MYSELMMREQGFDDGPRFRVMMHTDAIWRACRIILDVRMHRGELTVDEATDFLVEQTGFQRSNARAEVDWYTYRPTYPMSYLLGRTLLLSLRADEQRRLGDAFSLRDFHDTLLRNGSLPISFHRTTPRGRGLSPGAGHPVDRPRGRALADRLLARRGGRGRRPDRSPGPHRGDVRGDGRDSSSTWSTSTVRGPARRLNSPSSARSRRGSPSRSRWRAAWTPPTRSGSRSPPVRPGSC